ncbi:hypothetical protein [Streptomyces fulvoviolaceus]|uniref:hypothetical protein n=1 Tax=Streptomyces fulvoviolaceus TaxID=285535 RepID=UPI0021BF7E2C|nr:hypothetical protein [Streptomyces fulvoviolaceus]MCT9084172.1 hypothetical protein [Streptomyces fulvoviolaceus]
MPAVPSATSDSPPASAPTHQDEPDTRLQQDAGPDPRPESGIRWRRRLATSLAVAASLATVVSLGVTLLGGRGDGADGPDGSDGKAGSSTLADGGQLRDGAQKLTSSISVGSRDAGIGQCEFVQGQLTGPLPENKQIAVFVEDNHGETWLQEAPDFPKFQVPANQRRSWNTSVTLGDPKSAHDHLEFTIRVVLLPSTESPVWGGKAPVDIKPSWTKLSYLEVTRQNSAHHCQR